jgi:oligoribonuclease NrnB/cAMP/cGMP phosphodiesterase (DHH superfamily)
MQTNKKYRLLTRSDLDGLVCAVLLRHLDLIDDILLIDSPGSMSAGEVPVKPDDIIANLPYVPGVHLCFDHHVSETIRNQPTPGYIIDPDAPSAARVVYEYYGGRQKFPRFFKDVMTAVDKADSGDFSREEILSPTGWPLLNFLVDTRSRIERWGKFAINEIAFKMLIIDLIGKMPIDEIMEKPDVKSRAEIYFKYEQEYKAQLASIVSIFDNIAVLDVRKSARIYPGNRFVIYAMYPQCNTSIQIREEKENDVTTFSVGKSIINRTSKANIGKLMFAYGGGGHRAAGACHVDNSDADRVFGELVEKLREMPATRALADRV